MNIEFWGTLLLMSLIAITLLVIPLLRVRQRSKVAYRESNVSIFDDKLKELKVDLEDGVIDQAHYQFACNELERELLIDVADESVDRATASVMPLKRKPVVAVIIAVFVPITAVVLYLNLGMYSAMSEATQAQTAEQGQTQAQMARQHQMSIPEMIKKLQQRIDARGGSEEDWTMLGRAYEYTKDYAKATQAFGKALALSPKNTDLMLAQAESMALQNNKQFGEPSKRLILKVLKLQPGNMKAMWFAGVAEFQAGDYHKSINYMTLLADTGTVKNAKLKQIILGYVTAARRKLIASGEKMPELESMEKKKKIRAMSVATTQTTRPARSSSSASSQPAVLHIHVTVSKEVKQQFKGDADVFVYAKAQQGPKMPLAVKRMKLSQFPATIVLSDSMAMMKGMNMSAFGKVIISARVTTSGSAIARPGDYIGTVKVNDVHTDKTINVIIKQRI